MIGTRAISPSGCGIPPSDANVLLNLSEDEFNGGFGDKELDETALAAHHIVLARKMLSFLSLCG